MVPESRQVIKTLILYVDCTYYNIVPIDFLNSTSLISFIPQCFRGHMNEVSDYLLCVSEYCIQ